jgi:hypothetical protein
MLVLQVTELLLAQAAAAAAAAVVVTAATAASMVGTTTQAGNGLLEQVIPVVHQAVAAAVMRTHSAMLEMH